MEQQHLLGSICWLLWKISLDFYWILGYHKVSTWICALILRSIALSQAGWGSDFPSETTTDSSLLREREEQGSGCTLRVGRGKGCLRSLSAWGSCWAGEDDQESPYFSFPGLPTLSGGYRSWLFHCPPPQVPHSWLSPPSCATAALPQPPHHSPGKS